VIVTSYPSGTEKNAPEEYDETMKSSALLLNQTVSRLTLFQSGCYSRIVPIGRGFEPAGIVLGSSARSASTQPKEHTSRPLFHVPHESRRNAPTQSL
jgi:hypothetical protein